MLMTALDMFAWQQMTLASGLIGPTEQAAQVVLIGLMTLSYMSGHGMESPTSAFVGHQILQARVNAARNCFRSMVKFFLIVLAV